MDVVDSTSKAAAIELPFSHSTSISSMVLVVASLNCVGNSSTTRENSPSFLPLKILAPRRDLWVRTIVAAELTRLSSGSASLILGREEVQELARCRVETGLVSVGEVVDQRSLAACDCLKE